MADPQFEQFREIFEKLPQHIKAPQHCYRLTHDLSPDFSPEGDDEGEKPIYKDHDQNGTDKAEMCLADKPDFLGLLNTITPINESHTQPIPAAVQKSPTREVSLHLSLQPAQKTGERKRRKLPPIPTSRTATSASVVFTTQPPSLADEICEAEGKVGFLKRFVHQRQLPAGIHLPLHYDQRHISDVSACQSDLNFPEEDSSPEEKLPSGAEFDSGNSTTHSPDGAKCFSPSFNGCRTPESTNSSSGVSSSTLELLEATHRGLHKFVPRHVDEVEIEIGDPVYIQKEADDLWCEGVNLRTGKRGAFPSAYVTDVEYTDFDPDGVHVKKERYLLHFLGSLEVSQYKGNEVLCQAVHKIVRTKNCVPHPPHPCILEVSDQGLRMVDKGKPPPNHVPCHDYFFNLKNVTFCGYHPKDHRYFGFITKHPTENRLACHIFVGDESTRSVAEAVGRAFHKFYNKFIETAYPVEDIYLE